MLGEAVFDFFERALVDLVFFDRDDIAGAELVRRDVDRLAVDREEAVAGGAAGVALALF